MSNVETWQAYGVAFNLLIYSISVLDVCEIPQDGAIFLLCVLVFESEERWDVSCQTLQLSNDGIATTNNAQKLGSGLVLFVEELHADGGPKRKVETTVKKLPATFRPISDQFLNSDFGTLAFWSIVPSLSHLLHTCLPLPSLPTVSPSRMSLVMPLSLLMLLN